MSSRIAVLFLAPTLLGMLAACDSSSDPKPDRAAWQEVTRAGVTFEIPPDWTDEDLLGPCQQNDPCSSDPATLSSHVYFIQPLVGQRGGCCEDIRATETKRGWRAIEAFEGVDMYVQAETQDVVQRVINSARPADG